MRTVRGKNGTVERKKMIHLWIHNSKNRLDHMDVVETIGTALLLGIANLGRERAHAQICLEREDVEELHDVLGRWLGR